MKILLLIGILFLASCDYGHHSSIHHGKNKHHNNKGHGHNKKGNKRNRTVVGRSFNKAELYKDCLHLVMRSDESYNDCINLVNEEIKADKGE